jgi:hypothetical protein
LEKDAQQSRAPTADRRVQERRWESSGDPGETGPEPGGRSSVDGTALPDVRRVADRGRHARRVNYEDQGELIANTQVTSAMLGDAARMATEVGEGIKGELKNLLA